MLEHTKTPHTKPTSEVVKIYFAKKAQYVIPQEKIKDLINILENLKYVQKFRNGNKTKNKPNDQYQNKKYFTIEEVFSEDIKKYTTSGLALQGARLKEGYTQVQLAKKMAIRQENLSKLERGKRPISLKMAKRFAKILKVNYKVFI